MVVLTTLNDLIYFSVKLFKCIVHMNNHFLAL